MAKRIGEGLTFEKVWAAIQETERLLKVSSEETDRKIKEVSGQIKETDRQMKETKQAVKEASRIVGDLGNKFGRLSEHLIVPNMLEKFKALGYGFTRAGRNIKMLDSRTGKTLTETDLLLEDGDSAMVVEIKSDLTISDVRQHVERMGKLRRYFDERHDGRKLLGAVAGAIMEDRVKDCALEAGFYTIVQSGDTVKIDTPQGFTPKAW